MKETYNREKILEALFDPEISKILSELEDGKKEISYLAKKSEISEEAVMGNLSYLIECGFILEKTENNKKFVSANSEKLSQLMENDENFGSAIDGLTKLDSYLN